MTDFDDEESACDVDDTHPLIVYEHDDAYDMIPKGFTSATVSVDLRPKTALSFEKVCKEALWCKENGYGIVFDLDFGFFDADWKGFSHQGYFQSCTFSLSHFVSEVLCHFEEDALGCILGRFSLNCMHHLDKALTHDFFVWKKENNIEKSLYDTYLKALYFRDALVFYLEMLAAHIISSQKRILLFDAQGIENPYIFYRLIQSDAYDAFSLALSKSPFYHDALTWQSGQTTHGYIGKDLPHFSEQERTSTAIVLPAYKTLAFESIGIFESTFQNLIQQNRLFKVVPESSITNEWHGIDEFIVCHAIDNESTKRALDGFIATGGVVRIHKQSDS